jgi:hypothetical protein
MEKEITIDQELFQRLLQTEQLNEFMKHNEFVFIEKINTPMGCVVFRNEPDGKVKIIQGI